MDRKFEELLLSWPLSVIRDVDIASVFTDGANKRYAAVNRALKKGILVNLRRGLYLIGKRYRKTSPSNFEIAHLIYGPSYISFESALCYHQWIPEAVYTTMCATAKRGNDFETPIGSFKFFHVPDFLFYLGVQRAGNDQNGFYVADPWKALADHYYVFQRNWNDPEDLFLDMRIEMDDMLNSDLKSLEVLSENYQSNKVKLFLRKILKGLKRGN
jgi:hypothetical protein